MRARPPLRFGLLIGGLSVLAGPALSVRPAGAQILITGSSVPAEKDLTPEQEQHLLAEYWKVAKGYRLDPAAAIKAMSAWTRDRVLKSQSIQYQPETTPRPDYLEGKAEWDPAVLRLAAMLHSDLGVAALRAGNVQEFEFQIGIADGWLALADNRQSAPGSLRSRWNVTVARLVLAGGNPGLAERLLMRLNERIGGDAGILLAYGTVKETQALRLLAGVSGGKLDDPPFARQPRDAALRAAQELLEKALKADPALVEGKVRLAHVHVMKGEDAAAERLLTEALAAQPAPALKYVASLLLGGIRERARQGDAAAHTYLDAILAAPEGQSGYIALAHLLYSAGQHGDAATVLERWIARGGAASAIDPWWIYPMGLDLTMDAQLEEYRAQIRK